MRLTRDKVISVTERGDLVGVYAEGSCGCEILFECSPDLADKLIELWNTSRFAAAEEETE